MGLERVTGELMREVLYYQTKEARSRDYVETGYIDLDYALGGLKKGETYILAARPAMGKTAFALNLIEEIAVRKRKGVAIFSPNTGRENLLIRLVQILAKIERQDLQSEACSESNRKIKGAIDSLEKSYTYIDDTPDITIQEVEEALERLAAQLSLIVVDCLQAMGDEETDEEKLESLRRVAQKANCPVLILSQLSNNRTATPT